MEMREVVIVGRGIGSYSAALALAKRGISVTILVPPSEQCVQPVFLSYSQLIEKGNEIEQLGGESLSWVHEQFAALAHRSVEELLGDCGNEELDIQACLEEQLKKSLSVEWLFNYSLVELLTLDKHSTKRTDQFKKPTCIGVSAYNHQSGRIERFLSKEVILVEEGAVSLFPYSTRSTHACGQVYSIAWRAGVRLLNMGQIQFHPLNLYVRDQPCFPLPLELLEKGELQIEKGVPLQHPFSSSSDKVLCFLYDQLLEEGKEHFWLDLTGFAPDLLKRNYASLNLKCSSLGYHPSSDLLPVMPAADHSQGGILVDRTAQTTLQRLRATGEACFSLFTYNHDRSLFVLENLIRATACAEDIAKQIKQLIYYFPECKSEKYSLTDSKLSLKEDWKLLKSIMWFYAGIKRDHSRLKHACSMLHQLHQNQTESEKFSFEQIQLTHAIKAAQIIVEAALLDWPS